jgi:PKD repeat protein
LFTFILRGTLFGLSLEIINTFRMKKIFYFTLVIPFFLASCEKTPVAVFHTDTIEPEVGHNVIFYNDSHDAVRFEWDFGDGYVSNDVNPIHSFNATGTYEVKLTAISKSDLEDKASLTLNVLVPTLLEIQVLEYYDKYIVPDARIILYPTLVDWDAQTNPVLEGFTDEYGVAVFAGLEPVIHYVDVLEQNHDNYALASEDVGFIRTPEIMPHVINRFIAYVDYVEHGKGAAKGKRQVVIKKLERRAADMMQPPVGSSSENWQDLYNRRVNK